MRSDLSPEFLKATAKNWRTPREREALGTEMRKNGSIMDRKIHESYEQKRLMELSAKEQMAEALEPAIHQARKTGQITGGAQKHLFTSLHH